MNEGWKALVEVLQEDGAAEVRREAALALGGGARTDPALVFELERALGDGSDVVRRGVLLALGHSHRAEATEVVLRALEERPELWQEAAAALVALRDPTMWERLVDLLRGSAEPRVRRAAARALAGLSVGPGLRTEEPLGVYEDEQGVLHALV